jgi:hypothetical protein
MTIEQLASLEAAYRAASEQAERTRGDRNDGIRQALAEGHTHAWVAKATGLSRGRINQIAQGE